MISLLKTEIEKKIFGLVFLTGSIVIAFLSGFHFYSNYLNESAILKSTLTNLQKSATDALSNRIWEMDQTAIKEQLSNITEIPYICYASVSDDSGTMLTSHGVKSEWGRSHIVQRFDVYMSVSLDQKVNVGSLEIVGCKSDIISSLATKTLGYLLEKLFFILLVSYISTILINRMIANRWNAQLEELQKEINFLTQNIEEQQHMLQHSARLASLGEVAGGIAHEINNPLSVISGYASQIQKGTSEPDFPPELIEDASSKIVSTADNIHNLVRKMLAYARGGQKDPVELIIAKEAIEDALTLCQNKIKNAEVNIICEQKDLEQLLFFAQKTPIIQVIVNLVSNAIDATENLKEKWVNIEVKKVESLIHFYIIDSGSGIPKDIAEKIFQPFYSTKEAGKGTGLGLGICSNIIKESGGKIWIDDTRENTCFAFSVPSAS